MGSEHDASAAPVLPAALVDHAAGEPTAAPVSVEPATGTPTPAAGKPVTAPTPAAPPAAPARPAAGHRRQRPRITAERVLAAVLVALLIAALVPMVAISAYDHSYADDWHYAVDVHLALEAGGGLIGALRAALAEVVDTFHSWQGTYSAIFLMALEPGVWGEDLYGFGAIAIIASLVAATDYLAHALICEVLGAPRSTWLAVTAAVLLLQTQLLPSPVEGFWWYNAAVYYTFYHALMLVMAALALRLLRGRTRRGSLSRAGVVLRAVVLTLLAFVVAGGNFVTALVTGLALAAAVVAGTMHPARRGLALVPALLVFAAGFAVSLAAPGNAVRQATQFPADALGPVATIAKSILAGGEYVVLWTNGLLVLMLALVLPLLTRAAARSRWRFRLPGLVLAGSLALFMASFTPTFYSMGSVGPGRVQNIRYDLFVLLVFGCATYLAGWCARRWPQVAVPPTRPRRVRALAVYAAVLLGVLALSVTALALDERHADDLVSLSATRSLASGQAVEYDRQVRARIERIEGTDAATVEVPYITTAPKVLFMGDIRDNMDTYINFRLAQWYGKDAIIAYHAQL